ncbi:AGE family epimerase/isomerase [Thalassotalea sp. G2M2-11]|uniref:AGE family epimerase/isomerase n=1 Tax=Thalassotalea sp. G2M2-11 TaxID=2787627 RepID=UPI0019D23D4A|nr:AGE family epimerase/isomerase [Thalassotalea sp. G2M2-11]
MKATVFSYQSVREELDNIANWWMDNTLDRQHGGFIGEMDHLGNIVKGANKGIILNSRILWFFSELAIFSGQEDHKKVAERAFEYFMTYFDDRVYGGALWELSAEGEFVHGKKQTYAQCFSIYALSAYYKLTQSVKALVKANEYFELIEKHARDRVNGGYVEASTRDWLSIEDFRLSEKDLNVPKSMNTHLHVLEAYASFYQINPTEKTEEALRHVIEIFVENIVDQQSGHQKLFFDMTWKDKSSAFSYGHDIEASWLLWEAVELLGDEAVKITVKPIVLQLASACLAEAIGDQGQVCDEFDFTTQRRHQSSEWWVQAEALVGFMNAYYLTANTQYLDVCKPIWQFINHYHLDKENGEWHWLSSNDTSSLSSGYKVGFWKAPYHNGRAMMELCRLFKIIEAKGGACA